MRRIEIEEELYKEVEPIAKREGLDVGSLCKRIFQEYVKKHKTYNKSFEVFLDPMLDHSLIENAFKNRGYKNKPQEFIHDINSIEVFWIDNNTFNLEINTRLPLNEMAWTKPINSIIEDINADYVDPTTQTRTMTEDGMGRAWKYDEIYIVIKQDGNIIYDRFIYGDRVGVFYKKKKERLGVLDVVVASQKGVLEDIKKLQERIAEIKNAKTP
jgi:hypothetical protein